MGGKIAAVHRRDVFWIQRTKIVGVIPVEEVAPETFQLAHGGESLFKALRCI